MHLLRNYSTFNFIVCNKLGVYSGGDDHTIGN